MKIKDTSENRTINPALFEALDQIARRHTVKQQIDIAVNQLLDVIFRLRLDGTPPHIIGGLISEVNYIRSSWTKLAHRTEKAS